MNVLLVDDEVAFVEALARRLTRKNMTVHTVHNGPEALDFLRKNPSVDAVVLDVVMPGPDGLKVQEIIRKEFPLVEVIMLSGNSTTAMAVQGMKQGAFDYLSKPCSTEELIEKLHEAKRRRDTYCEELAALKAGDIVLRRGD
ncbi:response regulator receiver protein [Oleidesulfovibrio alaskensis G20]|jgi:DNA-binding response OmpR family regulator|uniref:Response regulator receiver protein n=1 Tax=Oleidesulfovibrio alaskensis (strain ATCC BAA-1058 / DSM 17464 / G20) TaxID=207559 RepID=Q315A0_OLEA2|nr:response regulator [Oleidesulfovibrio alaskensis]ABB37496.1 response regulator receiver protein [Oleidesulfovibrio alaskensis G20]MBL3581413.1 response regulator [Oleidesulfovibrio alaskensis]